MPEDLDLAGVKRGKLSGNQRLADKPFESGTRPALILREHLSPFTTGLPALPFNFSQIPEDLGK